MEQPINSTLLPNANTGTQLIHLTGAPVLIQIGSKDDYDRTKNDQDNADGTVNCRKLVAYLNSVNSGHIVDLAAYEGAYHAWDRLMVPVTVADPFGNEGSFFTTRVPPNVRLFPDVDQAFASRQNVVRFFRRNL